MDELKRKIEFINRVRSSDKELINFIKEKIKYDERFMPEDELYVFGYDYDIEGFYIGADMIKYFPPEVQSFFVILLDCLEEKYCKKEK